jgi:hypothetical protein
VSLKLKFHRFPRHKPALELSRHYVLPNSIDEGCAPRSTMMHLKVRR